MPLHADLTMLARLSQALARANDLFIDRSWGDGLPLWPATRERVDWILRGSSRPRTHVLGAFPLATPS